MAVNDFRTQYPYCRRNNLTLDAIQAIAANHSRLQCLSCALGLTYCQQGIRNTLDCDQTNYSSRIVSSYIPIEFGPTANSAIRSIDSENPTL